MTAPISATADRLLPVVLIDDNPDDLFFVKRLLVRGGVANPVISFVSGESAVAFFESTCTSAHVRTPASAIFCDVKMPRMNGFAVVSSLRALPALREVPIWLISTSELERDRERAHECRATGYLVKFPIAARLAAIVAEANEPIARKGMS